MCIWVDDVVGAATTKRLHSDFMADFRFPISDGGAFDFCLKIKIEQFNGMVALSQPGYITDIAHKFNVHDANPKYTPMEAHAKFNKTQCPQPDSDEHKDMASIPYRELLGCLNYAAGIRGDIAFSVSVLARFANNPARVHWKALKRVAIYLKTTRERSLVFGRNKHSADPRNPIEVYVDADHGGCMDTHRSTSGTIICVFGDTTTTQAKRQTRVSNSTGAAELFAIAKVTRKITNYRVILEDLGFYQRTVTINTDSRVAIDLIKRGYMSAASKHLMRDFHEVKEAVDSGLVRLQHVPGVDNPSDVLTKALDRKTHEKHTNFILNDKGAVDYKRVLISS